MGEVGVLHYHEFTLVKRAEDMYNFLKRVGQLTVLSTLYVEGTGTLRMHLSFDPVHLPRFSELVFRRNGSAAKCILDRLCKKHLDRVYGSQAQYTHDPVFSAQTRESIEADAVLNDNTSDETDIVLRELHYVLPLHLLYPDMPAWSFTMSMEQRDDFKGRLQAQLDTARNEAWHRMLVFCQGMHSRLGAASVVRIIDEQVAWMINEQMQAVFVCIQSILD